MTKEPLYFSVTGEFITEHARDREIERGWGDALRFLETINGLDYEMRVGILAGRLRMVGNSRDGSLDLVDDAEKERFSVTARRYAGIVRGNNRWVRPYAFVMTLSSTDHREWVRSQPWRARANPAEFWKERSRHYCRNPTDEIHRAAVPSRPDLPPPRMVIFEECGEPPPWWAARVWQWDDAVAQYEKHVRPLPDLSYTPGDEPARYAERPGAPPANLELIASLQRQGIGLEAAAGTVAAVIGDNVLDESPDPVAVDEADHGYILGDGRFYPCAYHQHAELARVLFEARGEMPEDPEKAADAAGWVRIQTLDSTGPGGIVCGRLTARQRATWEAWALAHGVKPSALVEVPVAEPNPGAER